MPAVLLLAFGTVLSTGCGQQEEFPPAPRPAAKPIKSAIEFLAEANDSSQTAAVRKGRALQVLMNYPGTDEAKAANELIKRLDAEEAMRQVPSANTDNSTAMAAALARFSGLPGVRHTEWLRGDFIIAAVDNGRSWQPVAETTCRWIRDQGMTGEFSVNVLEAGALLNRKWTQLSHARCN